MDRRQFLNQFGLVAGTGLVASNPVVVNAVAAGADVCAFGAKGDGKTDDSEAFEKAVAATNGTLYLPRGQYLLKRTIRVDLDKTGCKSLLGDGTATLLMAAAGPALHLVGTHNSTADPSGFEQRVWDRQRMPLVSGFEIRGAHDKAVGICLEKTMQATLSSLALRRLRYGIHCVQRNRNLIVEHCHVYHNREVGIYFDEVNLHQAILATNHISYNPVAGIYFRGGELRNFQITGNDIEYNHDTGRDGSADILVDMSQGGSFREATIVSNTIQARPSPRGANVRVLGGENLKAGGLMAISGNLIGSQTDNIHVDRCRGVSVSGNSIYSAAARSLALERSANVVFTGNTIDWNPDHRGKRLVDGITVENCDSVVLSGSTLENSFHGSKEAGGSIEISNSRDVTVSSFQVLDPRHRGIVIRDSERCRVDGCTLIDRRKDKSMLASIEVSGTKSRHNVVSQSTVSKGSLRLDGSVQSSALLEV